MNLTAPPVISGDARYAYATGVVRGKWAKRPVHADFARLLDAEPDEIGKILTELGFSGADSDTEAAIAAEWERTLDLVENLSQDPEVTDLMRMFVDFTNGSLAVKCAEFDLDIAPLFLPGGTVSAEDMIEFVAEEDNGESIPEEVREAMRESQELYEQSKIPLLIDVASDSHFARTFVERFNASGREFLAEYVRRWADVKNLTSYLRIRTSGIEIDLFKRFFIEGGHISKSDFSIFEEMEIDAIPSRLVYSIYGKPLADAVVESIRSESFQPLSRFLANMLEDFLRMNVYISFGLEVLVAFALLKYREIRAIGAIVRMKNARIEKNIIAERVRYGEI